MAKTLLRRFEWSASQLDQLENYPAETKVVKALKKTPEGLLKAYAQMVASIRSEDLTTVTAIFRWLCYAERPLRLDEVLEILAFDAETRSHRLQTEPNALGVLRMCRGLVVPQYTTPITKDDPASQFMDLVAHKDEEDARIVELRWAHSSVQNYLTSNDCPEWKNRLSEGPSNQAIAQHCIAYLDHISTSDSSGAQISERHPLARYAAQFWVPHVQAALKDDSTSE